MDEIATSEIEIAAEPEAVWQVLTTDEGFGDWMGEGARIDAAEDGEVVAPDPVTGEPKEGRVNSVDPGRRIDLTWWPSAEPLRRSDVSILVDPVAAGTLVRVIERRPAGLTAFASTAQWNWRCACMGVSLSLVRV